MSDPKEAVLFKRLLFTNLFVNIAIVRTPLKLQGLMYSKLSLAYSNLMRTELKFNVRKL